MKTANMKTILLILLCVAGLSARAEMDVESRDALIEKLTLVRKGLSDSDTSNVPVTLRLADLLAERARLASMAEINKGCETCTAGVTDRKLALELYQNILDKVPEEQSGRVLIQLGHLHQLAGEDEQALKYYQRLSPKENILVRAESQLSIGELYFKARNFKKAEAAYKSVLDTNSANGKGLAAYRLAWCAFNLEQAEKAKAQLIVILKTPTLQSRQTVSNQPDPQFVEEISVDLATFMAQTRITEADLKLLYDLSPERAKVSNILALAAEAGRIGKKSESLMVLTYSQNLLTDPSQKYNSLVQMSILNLDLGKKDLSLDQFRQALALRSQIKTCDSTCASTDQRLRESLITWNKIEKTTPTPQLAEAYRIYLVQFPESEGAFLSASVHRQLKMYPEAWAASTVALNLAGSDASKTESLLLYRLELAELGKNPSWLAEAQDQYISRSTEKSKIFEVRYQKAQAAYDGGHHQEAADQMHALALDKAAPIKLRKQAADLALDSLVILKSDAQMYAWAKEFSEVFEGGQRQEYLRIRQKALITHAAALGESAPEKALALMADFQPEYASAEDRLLYTKNKLLLAEKAKSITEARAAAEALLLIPKLSAVDTEFALGKKARFADLILDFSSSLQAMEKMRMEKVAPDQRLLKLALYSQLAGASPHGYFRKYLTTAKPSEISSSMALEILKSSADPLKELNSYYKLLAYKPEILAEAYLFTYYKTHSLAVSEKGRLDKNIAGTDVGKLFNKAPVLKEYASLKAKADAHQLITKNQRSLTQSIKARAVLLDQVEKFAGKMIASGDLATQLLSLDLLATSAERFHSELLSLPMPDGLSEEEQGEYMNLLSQQAAPYQAKATETKAKVSEFWNQTAWRESYKTAAQNPQYLPLLTPEITALKAIAPEAIQSELAVILETKREVAQANEIVPSPQNEEARAKVRSEPFNVNALKDLLALEKQAKNTAMVQYLEERIGGKNE